MNFPPEKTREIARHLLAACVLLDPSCQDAIRQSASTGFSLDDLSSAASSVSSFAKSDLGRTAADFVPYGSVIRGAAASADKATDLLSRFTGNQRADRAIANTVGAANRGNPQAVSLLQRMSRSPVLGDKVRAQMSIQVVINAHKKRMEIESEIRDLSRRSSELMRLERDSLRALGYGVPTTNQTTASTSGWGW